MILVDTSVWVDFFKGKDKVHVAALERFLTEGEDICICGVILTEVLQGFRDDADYRKTLALFDSFILLPMNRHTFLKAAEIYRLLRHRGIIIRRPVDCMIAAVAIQHDIPLLHNDRDFEPIEKYCRLRSVKT